LRTGQEREEKAWVPDQGEEDCRIVSQQGKIAGSSSPHSLRGRGGGKKTSGIRLGGNEVKIKWGRADWRYGGRNDIDSNRGGEQGRIKQKFFLRGARKGSREGKKMDWAGKGYIPAHATGRQKKLGRVCGGTGEAGPQKRKGKGGPGLGGKLIRILSKKTGSKKGKKGSGLQGRGKETGKRVGPHQTSKGYPVLSKP